MKFKERMELNNKTFNIIGDIAGRYDELLSLLEKMPKADLTIAVGDLIDRGKNSKKVIEYFMNTPNTIAIRGNHEQMMIDTCQGEDGYIWFVNGGSETVRSYGEDYNIKNIPEEHIKWLKSMPLYFETDNLFVSHAPITSFNQVPPQRFSQQAESFLWRRTPPFDDLGKFLIYGHNGRFKEHFYKDKSIGMCIDNSHAKQLLGVHWPTKEIFREDYIP